ncbi:MAG: hypothetical protein KAJ16_07080 [Calditrichia bacterium]|nr:hypothetical protein [Calditrichia bacterium]
MTAELFVYIGFIGVLLGILAIFFVLYRRIRWLLRTIRGKKLTSPKIIKGIRNLVLLLLWISIFSVLLFAGFFARAYHAFTWEKPIAKISIEPVGQDQTSRVTLTQFISPDSQAVHQFLIRGDQWMLEGDILKWDNWMNFFGWQTRYRLTRIRGRYIHTEDEIRQPPTIYSLVEREDDPLWRNLYELGPNLPFVDTVYGNAVFQTSDAKKVFLVQVSTSGFTTREEPQH